MKNTRIDMWTEQQWSVLTQQLAQMEEEILSSRREQQNKLAPSSFSYFLYEKKVEKYRETWTTLQKTRIEYGDKLCCVDEWEKLIQERIAEIIKQNHISQEDYPQNEQIRKRKERHDRYCMQWISRMYFSEEELRTWDLATGDTS